MRLSGFTFLQFVSRRLSLVAEGRDDRSEQRVEFGLEAGQASDDANADNSCDQAIFDSRCAGLVFCEIEDLLHFDSPKEFLLH